MKSIIQGIAGNRIISSGLGKLTLCYRGQPIQTPNADNDINKYIMFFRNGSNDAGNPLAYIICSGTGKTDTIEIVQGTNIDGGLYCPTYPYSWTDPRTKKIWYSATWKCTHGSDRFGDCFALYTYGPSLQSFKGGWDYWWYPNGTIAGSGSETVDVRKGVGNELSYFTMSANRAGPNCSGIKLASIPIKDWDSWYEQFITMNNGELVCLTNNVKHQNTANNRNMEFWYLSSNGSWIKSVIIPSGRGFSSGLFNGAQFLCSDRGIIVPTKEGVAITYMSSNAGSTTQYKLCTIISTDFGRTFGNQQILESVENNHCYLYSRPIIPYDSYSDNYARLFCLKTVQHQAAHKGSNTYIKFDTTDGIASNFSATNVGYSGSFWVMMTCCGLYKDGLSIWAAPSTDVGDSSTGDPRWVFWYDESDSTYGGKRAAGASNLDYDAHSAACIRLDDNNTIYSCGTHYFDNIPPDIVSSNTINGTYNIIFDNVTSVAGGLGCAFEVFE